MIIDSENDYPAVARAAETDFDVCVAGAGAAGISVARVLASQGLRVALLEAGGPDYSDESQGVYAGRNVGRTYMDLTLPRLRFLGGTTNHWNGACRPLDDWDLKPHAHIAHSGWPISKRDLDPFRAAAREILELGEFEDDVPFPGSDGDIAELAFEQSPPVRFKDKYEAELRASERIVTLLNANLVDITIDPDDGRVTGFVVRGYDNEAPRLTVRARQYVLALGGIENPRMLLNCNKQAAAGLGNERDLVGRYFMEHPHLDVGYYVVSGERPEFDERMSTWDVSTYGPSVQKKQVSQIANCAVLAFTLQDAALSGVKGGLKRTMKELLCSNEIIEDFAKSLYKFDCLLPVKDAGTLKVISEQVPNPDSRVLLGEDVDRFGLRRPVLDWRLLPLDKWTVREAVLGFAAAFANGRFGRVKVMNWLLDDSPAVPEGDIERWRGVVGHHMGTTRMAATPTTGVVDPNCRVFGHDNLYIAGSSVFTTGGHVNPTFSIVQLAVRLGHHLAAAQRS